MSKPRVLVCVRRLDLGGAETLESNLACDLAKIGAETFLIAQYSKKDFKGGEKAHYWKSKGVKEVFFLNAAGILGILKSIFRFFKIVKENKIDIVITSNSGLDSIFGLANFFLKIKHVVAFHTYPGEEFVHSKAALLWKRLLKKVDYYYFISEYVQRKCSELLKLDIEKSKVVYNTFFKTNLIEGYDLRRQLGLAPDDKIVVAVGRIENRKGCDLAVKYLDSIIKSNPKVHLVFVGDEYIGKAIDSGLVGFKGEVESLIDKARLRNSIHFAGFCTNIHQVLSQSDLLLHLARHEGFGITLLDAIYSGIPIVASNIGGIPEVLMDTPYDVFNGDDQVGIQGEVNRLLEMDSSLKNEMTENAKSILSKFTKENRAKEIMNIINKL